MVDRYAAKVEFRFRVVPSSLGAPRLQLPTCLHRRLVGVQIPAPKSPSKIKHTLNKSLSRPCRHCSIYNKHITRTIARMHYSPIAAIARNAGRKDCLPAVQEGQGTSGLHQYRPVD